MVIGRPNDLVKPNRAADERLAGVHAQHTKIVATLGPATDKPGVLDRLVESGIDCARLNCSHGTADDQRRRAREVREAAARAGRPLSLMFDLQGPKLRLAGETEERVLALGELVGSPARRCGPKGSASASSSPASSTSSPSARTSSSATASPA